MTFAESRVLPEIAVLYDRYYHITSNISYSGDVALLKATRPLVTLEEAVNAFHCSAYGTIPSSYILPEVVPYAVGSLPTLDSSIFSYLNLDGLCTNSRAAFLLNKSNLSDLGQCLLPSMNAVLQNKVLMARLMQYLPIDYRVNLLKALLKLEGQTSWDVNQLRPVINLLILLDPRGDILGSSRTLRSLVSSITTDWPR